jgi:hypothetical protein
VILVLVHIASHFEMKSLVCTYFRRLRMCGLIDAYLAAAKKDKLMPVKLIPEGIATLSTSPVVPLIKQIPKRPRLRPV